MHAIMMMLCCVACYVTCILRGSAPVVLVGSISVYMRGKLLVCDSYIEMHQRVVRSKFSSRVYSTALKPQFCCFARVTMAQSYFMYAQHDAFFLMPTWFCYHTTSILCYTVGMCVTHMPPCTTTGMVMHSTFCRSK
jgi:hypothetical protein